MFRMLLSSPGRPLVAEVCADPHPGAGEVRLRVTACGVCRTDLHVVDGELAPKRPTIVPGHEIVGVVDALGPGVTGIAIGERRGVPWLGGVCGLCRYCRSGRENLCDDPTFTGWTRDGGYADAVVARADFTFALPSGMPDAVAAPLLCAGLIGYRSWRMAQDAGPVERLGLYGFGAAAHLLAQLAMHHGQTVYAFTRSGDAPAQELARALGCVWAGASEERPPDELDAAIIFAPVGALAPVALRAVRKGGVVVCGGIHMSDIPAFPYELLWGERRLVSVANLTRQDAREYLPLAAQAKISPHVKAYGLRDANQALALQIDIRVPTNRLADYLIGLSKMAKDEEVKSLHACREVLEQFTERAKAAGVFGEALVGKADLYCLGEYVAERARTRDLCMVPIADSLDGQRAIAEAVIFGAGRPTLLYRTGAADLPQSGLKTVVQAWDGSRAAARAMGDALPLLKKANEVRVLTIVNEKPDAVTGEGADAVRHLKAHGVNAVAEEIDAGGKKIGAVLDRYMQDVRPDLFVMGAYGRSRVREFILGGATEYVLHDPKTPLLLSH